MSTGGEPRGATLAALRAVIDSDGLADVLGGLLADEVHWAGTGPGGECRSRADVQRTIGEQLDRGIRPRLRGLRPAGDRVLLEVELERAGGPTAVVGLVLTLDARGRVTGLQDYADAAAAHHDLVLAAAGGGAVRPSAPVSALIPFAHVADVSRSVSFYRLLGFEPTDDHEEDEELVWVALASGSAALMLARADDAVRPGDQAILFYLYARELRALREHLVAHGVQVGEIVDGSPGPAQEMRVTDPDGYCLMIAQTDAEAVAAGASE